MKPKLSIKRGTLETLLFVDSNPNCNLAAIVRELGLSPHTVHNRINELYRIGWVSKTDRTRMNNTFRFNVTSKGHEAACLVHDLYRTLEADA